MKPQAFQPGELRDEHDQIIRAGTYGKKTPFVSSENNAILDYIMNNFDALYAQIPNGRTYVKSVNNITPDSNGNVTINVGSGGGGTGGTNITVDSTLSSVSTNPVQNKVIYAALNNKLDKNGTATYATCDSSGNIISSTYARKTELSGYVKSINNVKPDSTGNVNISNSGGGSNITVDTTLSSTSNNPISNKVVYDALNNKLDKNGTAMYASRDSSGNVFGSTYATKTELSKCVKSINNLTPDSSGNVNISTSGGGTNITVDTALSGTSNNAISNKAVYEALSGKLDKTGTAAAATKATQDGAGNVIVTTYARKSDLSGYVKTINKQAPDASGNINISTGGTNGAQDLTPYMKKIADSDLDMRGSKLKFITGTISYGFLENQRPGFIIDASNSEGVNIKAPKVLVNGSPILTNAGAAKTYAPLDSPDFTGTVYASEVEIDTSLTIPGGKIWIA